MANQCSGKAAPEIPALKPYRENPPYGILGRAMETSASFEARSAPSSYPTGSAARTVLCGGRSVMIVPTATYDWALLCSRECESYGALGWR